MDRLNKKLLFNKVKEFETKHKGDNAMTTLA